MYIFQHRRRKRSVLFYWSHYIGDAIKQSLLKFHSAANAFNHDRFADDFARSPLLDGGLNNFCV